MFNIQKLRSIEQAQLEKIVDGYVANSKLEISRRVSNEETAFVITEVPLLEPFVKTHDYSDRKIVESYNELIQQGHSFGAFVGDELVGFIVCEAMEWNRTLAVREFGVSAEYRKQKVGSGLMRRAIELAKEKRFRGVFCETQSTHMPAINFYRRLGFTIEGFDLAFYSNRDSENGEVAVFLRKEL